MGAVTPGIGGGGVRGGGKFIGFGVGGRLNEDDAVSSAGRWVIASSSLLLFSSGGGDGGTEDGSITGAGSTKGETSSDELEKGLIECVGEGVGVTAMSSIVRTSSNS